MYGSLPLPLRAMPLCRRAASSAASETMRRPEGIASQLAHDVAAEAVDHAFSRERDELHVAGLAGLEADGGAGGDVEAHAAGLPAVEFQRGVGLEEMVVRAHLNGTVAGVGHRQRHGLAAGIELDLAVLDEEFAGDHVWYLILCSV